jgi:hypothetical protein
LNTALTDAGYDYEFVGSKSNTLEGVTLRHEGYSGQNAAQVASYLEGTFPGNIADIVLIHAGHNYDATVTNESTIIDWVDAATRSMISTARTNNPNVTILLAQVVTSSKLPKYSYITNLNVRIASIATELHTSEQPVILVDQADGWDPVADTVTDMVHPTQQGAIKMANKWFDALASILPTPPTLPAGDDSIVISENFESSAPDSVTPPTGWTLIETAPAATYSNSISGVGSDGAGGSSGLAGEVSSTASPAPGNNGLPGAYLLNNTVFGLDSRLSGSFDFQLIPEGTADDVGFIIGDVADGITGTSDGELLYVRITEGSPNNNAVMLQDGTADGTASIVTNAAGTITNDTWYHAIVTWTPTSGKAGNFAFSISDFSSNVVTISTSGFEFAAIPGYIGFGSINDTIRFDNVSFTGTAPTAVITNVPAFDTQARSTSTNNLDKTNINDLAVGPVQSDDYFRTYLTFDLASASKAVDVTLELDGAIGREDNTTAKTQDFTLFKLDADWDGAAQPGPTGTALASKSIAVTTGTDTNNISFNSTALTAAFNAAVGGNLYLGVKSDQEGQAIRSFNFYASAEDAGQQPKLKYWPARKPAGTVIIIK